MALRLRDFKAAQLLGDLFENGNLREINFFPQAAKRFCLLLRFLASTWVKKKISTTGGTGRV